MGTTFAKLQNDIRRPSDLNALCRSNLEWKTTGDDSNTNIRTQEHLDVVLSKRKLIASDDAARRAGWFFARFAQNTEGRKLILLHHNQEAVYDMLIHIAFPCATTAHTYEQLGWALSNITFAEEGQILFSTPDVARALVRGLTNYNYHRKKPFVDVHGDEDDDDDHERSDENSLLATEDLITPESIQRLAWAICNITFIDGGKRAFASSVPQSAAAIINAFPHATTSDSIQQLGTAINNICYREKADKRLFLFALERQQEAQRRTSAEVILECFGKYARTPDSVSHVARAICRLASIEEGKQAFTAANGASTLLVESFRNALPYTTTPEAVETVSRAVYVLMMNNTKAQQIFGCWENGLFVDEFQQQLELHVEDDKKTREKLQMTVNMLEIAARQGGNGNHYRNDNDKNNEKLSPSSPKNPEEETNCITPLQLLAMNNNLDQNKNNYVHDDRDGRISPSSLQLILECGNTKNKNIDHKRNDNNNHAGVSAATLLFSPSPVRPSIDQSEELPLSPRDRATLPPAHLLDEVATNFLLHQQQQQLQEQDQNKLLSSALRSLFSLDHKTATNQSADGQEGFDFDGINNNRPDFLRNVKNKNDVSDGVDGGVAMIVSHLDRLLAIFKTHGEKISPETVALVKKCHLTEADLKILSSFVLEPPFFGFSIQRWFNAWMYYLQHLYFISRYNKENENSFNNDAEDELKKRFDVILKGVGPYYVLLLRAMAKLPKQENFDNDNENNICFSRVVGVGGESSGGEMHQMFLNFKRDFFPSSVSSTSQRRNANITHNNNNNNNNKGETDFHLQHPSEPKQRLLSFWGFPTFSKSEKLVCEKYCGAMEETAILFSCSGDALHGAVSFAPFKKMIKAIMGGATTKNQEQKNLLQEEVDDEIVVLAPCVFEIVSCVQVFSTKLAVGLKSYQNHDWKEFVLVSEDILFQSELFEKQSEAEKDIVADKVSRGKEMEEF